MTVPVAKRTSVAGNDVANLLVHFGNVPEHARYLELVRDQAAQQALARWPLLAEIADITELNATESLAFAASDGNMQH